MATQEPPPLPPDDDEGLTVDPPLQLPPHDDGVRIRLFGTPEPVHDELELELPVFEAGSGLSAESDAETLRLVVLPVEVRGPRTAAHANTRSIDNSITCGEPP